MRIAGVNLPDNKQLAYALPLIYGIGPSNALDILKKAGIEPTRKGSDLSAEEEQTIRSIAESYVIEGDLRREVSQNIKRLKDIRSERGIRHERRLPTRGQRTKTNSRSVRGNTRKTATSGRRVLQKT